MCRRRKNKKKRVERLYRKGWRERETISLGCARWMRCAQSLMVRVSSASCLLTFCLFSKGVLVGRPFQGVVQHELPRPALQEDEGRVVLLVDLISQSRGTKTTPFDGGEIRKCDCRPSFYLSVFALSGAPIVHTSWQ